MSTSRDNAKALEMLQCHRARPKRPTVTYGDDGKMVHASASSRTVDLVGLCEALGTRSADFMSVQVHNLGNSTRGFGREIADGPEDASGRLSSALALVAAIQPANELEAAIAVQMASTHELAQDMLQRARHTDRLDLMTQYGSLAVKLQRTFAAQLEALSKHRTAGKQIVEVKHVHTYVGAGGQAIVGDVHHTGGGGAINDLSHQPHALADASGSSLPGEDPTGSALPSAGRERAEALPHARGREPRRTVRREKRAI